MFKKKARPATCALTLRVLARLLEYPGAEIRANLGEFLPAIDSDAALTTDRRKELAELVLELQRADPYEIEARFVDTFDRGRSASLHLFEHVHGDSRDRGQAMVDLKETYARAGLQMADGELPDHLSVLLEFASTQPREQSLALLQEVSHILNSIFTALVRRQSPYASVIAAALELAGESPHAVEIQADRPLDAEWAEPPAFDGCSKEGQASPGQAQPIHIVRRQRAEPNIRDARTGARP